jgi:LPS O-antigen subunit length determinant protein (WzzB/FepE family)
MAKTKYKNSYFLSILIDKIYFIIIFTLFCGIFFFIYNKFFNRELQLATTIITIKKPPSEKFDIYNELYKDIDKSRSFNDSYFVNFKVNLLSKDNFSRFLDQFASSNNPSGKNKKSYFQFHDLNENKKKIDNVYLLKYPKELNGPELLNKYILYTRDITTSDFVDNLKFHIEYKLSYINDQKKLKFDEDVTEVQKLKLLLKNLNIDNLRFNPILDSAFVETDSGKALKYFFLGSFFGFFLSIIFIFFRHVPVRIE